MPIKHVTSLGDIQVSNEAIATVVGDAILECYGVVGLASNSTRKILKNNEYVQGVVVHDDKGHVSISVYVVLAYSVRITEVLSEVQKKVRYVVNQSFSIRSCKVNCYAVGLK